MTDALACHLCDQPMGEHETADCYLCGKLFHLQMIETADGPDCGDVWIDDEVLALQFACQNCIEAHAGGAPASPEARAVQTAEQQIAAALQASPDPPPPARKPPAANGPVRKAATGQSARDIARRRR